MIVLVVTLSQLKIKGCKYAVPVLINEGKIAPPKDIERISSVIKEKKTEHSKKPTYIRDMISKWYPDKNKLELFARPDPQMRLDGTNTFDGWDIFGNEVKSDIKLK